MPSEKSLCPNPRGAASNAEVQFWAEGLCSSFVFPGSLNAFERSAPSSRALSMPGIGLHGSRSALVKLGSSKSKKKGEIENIAS